MSKIISLAFAMLIGIGSALSQSKIADGFYIVQKVVMKNETVAPKAGEMFVPFDAGFQENAPHGSKGLMIFTGDYVPLELDSAPALTTQTGNRKKLELTFSRAAAEKLKTFTQKNVMKQASLVVNGKALTTNKIREAITGGKLEITSADDQACERIYAELKK